jgi:large subunit ribosomal protein L29
MKFAEISDLSKPELLKKKKALTATLFQAKMKNKLGQLANPIEIRDLRRDVARTNTALADKKARG